MALTDKVSNLSNPRYGYDFVVSTTQASINSGLKAFLHESNQPVNHLCFLADGDGNPTVQISLEELRNQTGLDPFDLPKGIPYDDKRIKTLTDARFMVGIKIQIGLPPGIRPKDLPPIVTLGTSADSVQFNQLFSQFTIVQNKPPGEWKSKGSWVVSSQPSGVAWYFKTKVDLVMKDLDNNLNTPYLNKHPEVKAQLRRQLSNMSSTAFSLRQLLFDLDNAKLVTLPEVTGVAQGSAAELVLQRSLLGAYSKMVGERGLPLVAVMAEVQSPNLSSLQMTSFERAVSLFKGDNGEEIQNPTEPQKSATTLNYLCAVDNKRLPPVSSFDWNWVGLDDINSQSGVITINRQQIAKFILNLILPTAKSCCFEAIPSVKGEGKDLNFGLETKGNQTPRHEIHSSGSKIISIRYESSKMAKDRALLVPGEFEVSPSYTCDVTFDGNTIVIKQNVLAKMYVQNAFWSTKFNAVDKTTTTTYTISVDQSGSLLISNSKSETTDNKQMPDDLPHFTNLEEIAKTFQYQLNVIPQTRLHAIPFNQLPCFVFPGGKVFTYKSAKFSDFQDLVCAISYVDPEEPVPQADEYMAITGEEPSFASIPDTEPALALTHSSEMMQNYLQGEIVSPTRNFMALQTATGHALLFSIDTSGVFQVIKEQSGTTKTGWEVSDLSSELIKAHFSDKTDVAISTFGVGQSVDGSIGLALAVSSGGTDTLFISLRNSGSNTSWTSKMTWTPAPFKVAADTGPITIAGILFAESSDKKEYLMVDVDRRTGPSATKTASNIERYLIESEASSSRWVKNVMPVDVEHGSYQSCVGRRYKGFVDGVYTSGKTGGAPQLVYVPLENEFGQGPPLSVRLSLPGGALPSAIASARNSDATTNLYAISGSTLYRFAPNHQYDSAIAQPLVTDHFLSQTDTLLAMTHDGVTTLWGKNSSDQVYYLSCPTSQLSLPGSWSVPVPILIGIERISAYMDKADGGNTIFASGGGKLVKVTQATNTTAKVWRPQQINLAAAKKKPLAFKSYTTTIHVADTKAGGLPVRGVTVSIVAHSHTPVYINGFYYVLRQTPVTVETDEAGSITIVEATEDLHAATLSVSIHKQSKTYVINPADATFNKIAKLDSEKSLRDARFTAETKAGGTVGQVRKAPLVNPSIKRSHCEVVAANLAKLKEIHASAQRPRAPTSLLLQEELTVCSRVVPYTLFSAFEVLGDGGIAIAIGDLLPFLGFLKSSAEATIKIVKSSFNDAWHFIATIAGKVYRAILDTTDAIVGAATWLFHTIETGVKNLIRFVEFLFNWDDIRRTKDVMHSIVKLYLQHKVVDGLKAARLEFDGQIAAVENTLNKWAGKTDWSSLGPAAEKPVSHSSVSPVKGQTSASQLLATHFRNNAAKSISASDENSSVGDIQVLVDRLLEAISQEGEVLSAVYRNLQQLAKSLGSMSVVEAIQRLGATLATGLLSSVQVVFDALLDVLSSLAGSAIKLLDTKIHVPVVSDILHLIGVGEVSFLDLFVWIAAVAYTVEHKAIHDEPPFPDNDQIKEIIKASSWDNLAALLKQETPHQASLYDNTTAAPFSLSLSGGLGKTVFIACHTVAGFTILMSNFLNVFEAHSLTGENEFSLLSTVAGIVAAAAQGGGDILTHVDPVEDNAVATMSKATTSAVLASKVFFWGRVQKMLSAKSTGFRGLAVSDGRATGAIVNAVLVIPALFVTGWHFYELSNNSEGATRSAAIVGEVSNLTQYVSRLSYAAAVNDKDPESKGILIVVMAASNICSGFLQTAEACIDVKLVES